jgi:hypothetical protein
MRAVLLFTFWSKRAVLPASRVIVLTERGNCSMRGLRFRARFDFRVRGGKRTTSPRVALNRCGTIEVALQRYRALARALDANSTRLSSFQIMQIHF